MRKACLFCCCFLFLLGNTPAFSSVPHNPVPNTTQPLLIHIPDSLDLSTALFASLNRREKINQFNRLIGVYLVFAIDTLKAGKEERAERIIMTDVLPMLTRYGDGYNMYHSFMTLGRSYAAQKKYTQSKWFFIQSNTIAKKIGYRSGELFSLIELAKVKVTIKDKSLALQDYRTAAALATKIRFTNTLADINREIRRLSAPPDKGGTARIIPPKR
jgi:hypothetical protein